MGFRIVERRFHLLYGLYDFVGLFRQFCFLTGMHLISIGEVIVMRQHLRVDESQVIVQCL